MEMIKIKNFKINKKNPRFRTNEFEKLVKSIKEFPQMMELRPIIVDADNMVLGGNMRLQALNELNYHEIPSTWVKSADKLTEAQKQEFIIKDNLLFGDWDYDVLTQNFDQDKLVDWGMDVNLEVFTDTTKQTHTGEIELDTFEDLMEVKFKIEEDLYFELQAKLNNESLTYIDMVNKFLDED